MFLAERMAERGYHVVVQTTRGRFDSEGRFEPFVDEAADGKATLAWLARQPWFDGRLGTWGASYLGYVQWAIAADAAPYLKAMVPLVSGSQLGSLIHLDGAFGLGTFLPWTVSADLLGSENQKPFTLGDLLAGPAAMQRQIAPAFRHLPLNETARQALGHTVGFYQDWLAHPDLDGPYWQRRSHSRHVPDVTVPVHLISGWVVPLMAPDAVVQSVAPVISTHDR